MTPNISITSIAEEDLDEIIKIGLSTKELWVNNGEPLYYGKEQLSSFIKSPNDIYLVAKVDDEIAGYRLATFNPYLKEAYLVDIAIKEKYRGMGIGTLLYKKNMEELQKRNCDWCWALVHEDNEKMKHFIEKQGFKKGKNFTFCHKPRPFI